MAFQISYETILTVRCWHPAFLGEASGLVPVTGVLTPRQEYDYLRYDLRSLVDLRPTIVGSSFIKHRGLQWLPTPQGGFLIGAQGFQEEDLSQILQLGFYPVSGEFASKTDFSSNDVQGRYFVLSNEGEIPSPLLDLNDSVTRQLPFEIRPPEIDPSVFGVIDLQPAGWSSSTFDIYFQENT